jgi:hypothetical protein
MSTNMQSKIANPKFAPMLEVKVAVCVMKPGPTAAIDIRKADTSATWRALFFFSGWLPPAGAGFNTFSFSISLSFFLIESVSVSKYHFSKELYCIRLFSSELTISDTIFFSFGNENYLL